VVVVTKQHTGVSSPYDEEGLSAPRDTRAAPRPGLVLLYAPNFEQLHPAYPFGPSDITIGRDPIHAICIPEQAVSRLHARIQRHTSPGGDVFVLTDLGSRNGTIVDGRHVHEVTLEPLSEVRVGDAIFKFVEEGADIAAAYRIDGVVAGQRRSRGFDELVGGAKMDAIAADIERIAPTELSCVVLGETGTGKEVVARGIHRLSGRRGSFQAINCAAIPQNLLESELFGYRRGAFSGADRDKPGLIKLADGGTLFLDEIGDMPIDAQAKLLRVLQSREVFPLGATMPERVDIRVVCATHRDLYGHVREGRFRGDLLARLNEHTVRLPPLRERKEDVLQLVRSFFARYGHTSASFTFSFMVALLHYDWPFNVRELESCVKRGLAIAPDGVLDTAHLPDAIAEIMRGYGGRTPREPRPSVYPSSRPPDVVVPSMPGVPSMPSSASPSAPGRAPTEPELRAILSRHKGNVAAVGRELGKERMQIHRWLKKFGISLDDYRS
jgi:transcriptional regulator with GAF, ATPase, and Fis domain